jgi:hypothetical protein
MQQAACRKLQKLFRCGKVLNTSVDKVVEIKAATSRNFRQFNILPRIALFVCKIGLFAPIAADAKTDDRLVSSKLKGNRSKIGRLPPKPQNWTKSSSPDSCPRANSFVITSLKKSKAGTKTLLVEKSVFSTTSADVRDEL